MALKSKYGFLAIILACLGMAGCTSNIVLINPPAANNAAKIQHDIASKCFLPPDQRGAYATAIAVDTFFVKPEPSATQHVDGCASAKFRLTEGGKAKDATLITESPVGFGFGDALLKEIQGSTFKPPVSTQQWYYMMNTTVFNPAAR